MSSDADEDEEWSNSESDGGESEADDDSESDFDLEEGESDKETITSFRLRGGRPILWLCQEGQIPLARKRFEWLLKQSSSTTSDKNDDDDDNSPHLKQLEKEVFQVGRDKNYALHEILMGGTSDRNAYQLTLHLLDFAKQYPQQLFKMLSAQPPSHQRTALHWATWGNAGMPILLQLINGYPEALVVRDKKGHGDRTPLEILKRYFSTTTNNNPFQNTNNGDVSSQERISYLVQCTEGWTQHRLRQEVHKCVLRYFAPFNQQQQMQEEQQLSSVAAQKVLTPFDKNHRKESNIKPKAWFVLSILGSLVQREMKPLVIHILGFMGKDAKVATQSKKRKRRASHTASINRKRNESEKGSGSDSARKGK